MNIEALSKQLGKNIRTVYRRIAKAGLSLDSLKDEQGQLTTEGIQAISALFDNDSDNDSGKRQNDVNKGGLSEYKALVNVKDKAAEKALSEARAEIERLKAEASAAEIRIQAAERERDLYKQMADKAEAEAASWKAAAERAQQLHAMQLQLLPQRAGVKGFFARIFNRKDGNGE